MNTIINFIRNVLSTIAFSIITIFSIVILAIVGAVNLPFDYIKYKCSLYYKTVHKKYHLFDAALPNFEIYNAVLKNKLPITYYPHPDDANELERGMFICGKTLIILDATPSYDAEHDEWVVELCEDNDNSVESLSDFLEQELADVNEVLKSPICDKAVIVIDVDNLKDDEKAKDVPEIYVYKKSVDEALIKLCESI